MAFILNRKQVLLAKAEVTEGTGETPSASLNAVQCENIRWTETPNVIQTNEYRGALDIGDPVIGGIKMAVTFDVYLNGSGTPETAPEWGILLKGCGRAETITASAVPAAPEACASGASQTQCTLGASATGTADLYNGMPITLTGTGAGSSFIAAYSAAKLAVLTDDMGATLSTGTSYQIPKNTVYRGASSSITSLTMWLYRDGKLLKGTGCRGDVSLTLTAGGPGKFTFTFSGIWVAASDSALVTPTLQNQTKPIWRGTANRMRWNYKLAQVRSFTVNAGNTVVYPDNPEATEGFDAAQITSRAGNGSFDPYETLIATRDIFSDMRAGTKRIVHARIGSTSGNRFGITIPNAMATANNQGEDRDGLSAESVTFRLTGANDDWAIAQY